MWKGELDLVSEAPVDEPVSIAELETGDHVVRFCGLDIGLLDRRGNPKSVGNQGRSKMSTLRAVEPDLLSV